MSYNIPYRQLRSPEHGPSGGESAADVFGKHLERVDVLTRMELLISRLTESGPELDPDHRESLWDKLAELLGAIGIDVDQPFHYVDEEIVNHRRLIDDSVGDSVDTVIGDLGLDGKLAVILRPVLEKIILARNEGLSDKRVYRKLVRTYHPDVTVYDTEEAEEIMKLIGQLLYDATSETFDF